MSISIFPSALIRILNRMFKLVQSPSLYLSELVSLQINAVEMMKEQVCEPKTANLSGGSNVTLFTCPKSERWYLTDLSIGATTGSKGGGNLVIKGITWSLTISGTAYAALDLTDIFLEEGDYIDCVGTGNGADTAIGCRLLYQRLKMEGN